MIQRRRARLLDRQELPAVGVVLRVAVGRDEQGIAAHKAQPPPRHVERLAHGMQFDGYVLCAGHGQNRQRFAFEHESAVRRVRNDDEFVLAGKLDRPRKKLRRRARACRVVRVIEHDDLRALERVARCGIEVGKKIVGLGEGEVVHLAAIPLRMRAKHGITRHGHDGHVAGIDYGRRQDRQRRLGPDAVDNLGVGVEIFHAEHVFHPLRRRATVLRAAIVRIAAVFGFLRFFRQGADAERERHFIGLAHAEIDQLAVRVRLEGGAFRAFDFFKFVDRGAFAKRLAADAFGQQLLDVRFRHGRIE